VHIDSFRSPRAYTLFTVNVLFVHDMAALFKLVSLLSAGDVATRLCESTFQMRRLARMHAYRFWHTPPLLEGASNISRMPSHSDISRPFYSFSDRQILVSYTNFYVRACMGYHRVLRATKTGPLYLPIY
jgi:hypothetical protein